MHGTLPICAALRPVLGAQAASPEESPGSQEEGGGVRRSIMVNGPNMSKLHVDNNNTHVYFRSVDVQGPEMCG